MVWDFQRSTMQQSTLGPSGRVIGISSKTTLTRTGIGGLSVAAGVVCSRCLPGCQSYTARPLEFDPEFARALNQPKPEAWSPTPGYCDQARKTDVDW